MSILSSFSFLVSTTCPSYIELCFLSLFGFLIIAIGSRRDKRVAGVWQVCGRCVSERVAGVWQVCGRCVAGVWQVWQVCGRCVAGVWQLVVFAWQLCPVCVAVCVAGVLFQRGSWLSAGRYV